MHENDVGRRFGQLTVIAISPRKANETYLTCRCDCGTIKDIRKGHLTSGKIISCGCYNRKIHADRLRSHGGSHTRLYIIWTNMKDRCYNPRNKRYDRYGGRGIKVCDEWIAEFVTFRLWALSNGYSTELTLDRKNNDGNYEPENCQWSDAEQQANNRSNTIYLELNGIKKTIKEWSNDLGIKINTIRDRLRKTDKPEFILREETIQGKRLKEAL